MFTEIGQPEVLKRKNRSLIMSLIENESNVSRASLARLSGLSRTTISNAIKELIEVGLIRETGDLASTGGRPGTRLELDGTKWYALGAELRNREWICVMLDLHARIVSTLEIPVDTRDARASIRLLCDGLQQMRARVPNNGNLLPAVGIGAPGVVEAGTGIIRQAVDLGWRDLPIASIVQEALDMQVYTLNRNRAAGLAEARYGNGRGSRELIYIGIGSGINAAVLWNGVLQSGANSSAGELGHVVVEPDGPLCPCGNRGCLSMLASGQAMVREAVRLFDRRENPTRLGRTAADLEALSGVEICEAAQAGDPLALATVRRASHYLAIVIINLIHLMNPDTIVIGGPIGQTGDPLIGWIREQVKERVLAQAASGLRILGGSLGQNAGAVGAASLVLDRKLPLIYRY